MFCSSPRSAVRITSFIGISALAVVLAGRGAVATTVTNAASPVWTPALTISDPAFPADQVSVASDVVYDPWQRAKSLAAWRVFDGEHWRIAVSTDLGGHWTSPQLVSPAGVDAGHPSAGVASEWTAYGSLYEQVAWLLSTGEVQVAVKPVGAKAWAAPVTISAPGAVAEAPISSVSWQDDGAAAEPVPAVVWLARDGSHWRAHYLTWWETDRPDPRQVVLLSPSGHDAADLSVSRSYWGVTTASWSYFDGTHWVPQWRTEGEFSSATLGTTTTATGEDARTPLAGDDSIVWTSSAQGHVRLRARLRAGWDKPLGRLQTVSGPRVDVSDVHVVASYPNAVVVVWLQDDGIATRVVTATGNPQTGEWQPPTYLSPTDAQAAELATAVPNVVATPVTAEAAWTQMDRGGQHQVVDAVWRWAGWTTPRAITPAEVDAANPAPVPSYFWQSRSFGVAWTEGPLLRVSGGDALPPAAGAIIRRPDLFSQAQVSWTAMDDWSPTIAYDIRTWTVRYGEATWRAHTFQADSTTTAYTPSLPPGIDYCVSVRATDTLGRVGDWYRGIGNDGTCIATPADDRQLAASSGWTRVRGAGYYGGSVLRTTRAGNTLSKRLVDAEDVRVLVAKGPQNGTITIAWDGYRRTVSLASATDRRRVWINAGFLGRALSGKTTRVTIAVVSHGRPVRIDGVWADRYPVPRPPAPNR